jgi:hypothetical protein
LEMGVAGSKMKPTHPTQDQTEIVAWDDRKSKWQCYKTPSPPHKVQWKQFSGISKTTKNSREEESDGTSTGNTSQPKEGYESIRIVLWIRYLT